MRFVSFSEGRAIMDVQVKPAHDAGKFEELDQ
jgi:hypothetical protein